MNISVISKYAKGVVVVLSLVGIETDEESATAIIEGAVALYGLLSVIEGAYKQWRLRKSAPTP